jgi:bacterioferritin-associated ferredoxin
MIVCVCNNITESQIRDNPTLLDQCATECATCEEVVAVLRMELSGVGGSNEKPVKSRASFEIRDLDF